MNEPVSRKTACGHTLVGIARTFRNHVPRRRVIQAVSTPCVKGEMAGVAATGPHLCSGREGIFVSVQARHTWLKKGSFRNHAFYGQENGITLETAPHGMGNMRELH